MYEENSNEIMHPLWDMNVLYDSFKKSMKGSAWKNEPQRFEGLYLIELNHLRKELMEHTYQTSEGTEFTLNERGHIRYIHGGRMRDRVVRHALCDNIINPALQPYLIYNNGASQKGKGMKFARDEFEKDLHNFYLEYGSNDGYIVFADFSKFYDNIQHELAKEFMYPLIDYESQWLFSEVLKSFEVDVSYLSDEEYADCINKKFNSIEYHETIDESQMTGEKMMPKSVDIGDQVSQSIGVSFPTRVDNYVKIVLGVKRYGRYMDDMYAICKTKEEAKRIVDGIIKSAEEIGLFVNKDKTYISKLSGKYTYLQIKYSLNEKGKVIKRINPKSVTRERRRLKKYKSLLDRGKMAYEDIKQSYKSWMGDFSRIMSKRQIKNMKELYKDLFGEDVRWKK